MVFVMVQYSVFPEVMVLKVFLNHVLSEGILYEAPSYNKKCCMTFDYDLVYCFTFIWLIHGIVLVDNLLFNRKTQLFTFYVIILHC